MVSWVAGYVYYLAFLFNPHGKNHTHSKPYTNMFSETISSYLISTSRFDSLTGHYDFKQKQNKMAAI